MKSIFILHRDLSIEDNLCLRDCMGESSEVYVIFIFTPKQADPTKNKYFGSNSFSFMLNSLRELSRQIPISFFYEDSALALARLIKATEADAVWENADYSPFARRRQETHKKICTARGIQYNLGDSITLAPMGDFARNGRAYVKFTPFYTYARARRIAPPRGRPGTSKLRKIPGGVALGAFKPAHNKGGRREALRLLRRFGKIATKYKTARDNLYIDGTSHLGPHLHFGTVSPREVYHFVGAPEFRKQLYWREFYMYISNYVALDYSKISWTLPKFNRVKWQTNNTALNRWKLGKTGIPIVDAGMRELVNSGHMHNRARMICAMYLIHYLGIHWREGERWFAQNLMDYSYANNYGGWVWCAGVEVHSNPYFRVYSMEQQNKRFDPDCIYIKKWCPELREQTPKEIFAAYAGLDKVRARRIEYLKSI